MKKKLWKLFFMWICIVKSCFMNSFKVVVDSLRWILKTIFKSLFVNSLREWVWDHVGPDAQIKLYYFLFLFQISTNFLFSSVFPQITKFPTTKP